LQYFIAVPLSKSADMRVPVTIEVSKYELLKQRLLASYPDLDEETLGDTLEGITDLHEMIAAVVRSALVDEAFVSGLRFRIDEMRERLSRLEERARNKRKLVLETMTEVGLTKFQQSDFTASVRPGSPAIIISAQDVIPKTYWIPQPPKLDRQAVLIALKRGHGIPGAELSNPEPVLVVRTK
jgi:hypothetical protein